MLYCRSIIDGWIAGALREQEGRYKDKSAQSSAVVHWLVTSSGADCRKHLARRTASDSVSVAMTALLPARIVSLSLLCPPAEPAGGGGGTVVVDACLRGNFEALHYRQPKMPMSMCDLSVNAASKAGCSNVRGVKPSNKMKLPELWGYFRRYRKYCTAL